LQTRDLPKAKDFYGRLFGWKLQDMRMQGGGYGWMSVFVDPTAAMLALWQPMNPQRPG